MCHCCHHCLILECAPHHNRCFHRILKKAEDQSFFPAILYHGKCSTSKNWVRGLLFLINTLSTIMLAASNYCMQCSSSPSREDVDNAHIQQRCLHIGVHSIKNLRVVGWRRCILWILLLVTSLPIHLMSLPLVYLNSSCLTGNCRYNSAVFSALGVNQYEVLLAPGDFGFKNPPYHDPTFANCFEMNAAMNMSSFYIQVTNFDVLEKTILH